MRVNESKLNEDVMIKIVSSGGKCWKENPKCDSETKQLVEDVKLERECGELGLSDW